jgi:hypothetical protein
MLSILTKEQVRTLYLSWVNDFLTVERFAEYYRIEESLAQDIINKGRSYEQ